MKTAISIPDDVFERAEKVARRLKISRSELYVRALEVFLRDRESDQMTQQINAVVDELGAEATRLDPVLGAMQWQVVSRNEW